ncbi:hypothetical protein OH77DRAFT_1525008 [Trametes cingulata]|nr:hypothetical protein OH77DRAFT_1525603 [Trametes cingulata]KAI0350312.1 hypothetical protein OH77DRAFT_1525008 [Trametes cingulata]
MSTSPPCEIIPNPFQPCAGTGPVDDETIVLDRDIHTSVIPRLRRLLDYAAPHEYHYSLTTVPPDAMWTDHADETLLSVQNDPVTIRALGTLRSISYRATHNCPAVFTVEIDLLRAIDHAAFVRLLRRGRPRPSTPLYHFFRAFLIIPSARYPEFMPIQRIMHHAQATFRHVYDATYRLRPNAMLTTINVSHLVPGDVVCADALCALEYLPDGNTRVRFELRSLYLIARITRYV